MVAGRLNAATSVVASATIVVLATKSFLRLYCLVERLKTKSGQTDFSFEETLVVIEQEGCWKGSCAVVSSDNTFWRSSQIFEL